MLSRLTFVCLGVTACLAGWFAVTSPIAFQKAATITAVDVLPPLDPGEINLAALIAAIPFGHASGDMVHAVHPITKHARTMLAGQGNCSNLSFGLAYELRERAQPYQIVHLLARDTIRTGLGHTVVRAGFRLDGALRDSLIDLAETGVPYYRGGPMRAADLLAGARPTSIRVLHPGRGRTGSPDESYGDLPHVAVLSAAHIGRYFGFLQAVYLPLGNERLEKIVYDGLAVALGFYPRQYVTHDDYEALFSGRLPLLFAAHGLVWSARLSLLLLVLMAVEWVIRPVLYRPRHAEADALA